jgi:hypothetical protein
MGEPMDRSNRFFAKLTTFANACPNIESASVEYVESSFGIEEGKHFHNAANGGLIRCGNPRCFRGGYEMEIVISGMERNKETESKGTLICQGDEGTPKGRKLGDPCGNRIDYTVKIKYKQGV